MKYTFGALILKIITTLLVSYPFSVLAFIVNENSSIKIAYVSILLIVVAIMTSYHYILRYMEQLEKRLYTNISPLNDKTKKAEIQNQSISDYSNVA